MWTHLECFVQKAVTGARWMCILEGAGIGQQTFPVLMEQHKGLVGISEFLWQRQAIYHKRVWKSVCFGLWSYDSVCRAHYLTFTERFAQHRLWAVLTGSPDMLDPARQQAYFLWGDAQRATHLVWMSITTTTDQCCPLLMGSGPVGSRPLLWSTHIGSPHFKSVCKGYKQTQAPLIKRPN